MIFQISKGCLEGGVGIQRGVCRSTSIFSEWNHVDRDARLDLNFRCIFSSGFHCKLLEGGTELVNNGIWDVLISSSKHFGAFTYLPASVKHVAPNYHVSFSFMYFLH
jgi:hypothetical protein